MRKILQALAFLAGITTSVANAQEVEMDFTACGYHAEKIRETGGEITPLTYAKVDFVSGVVSFKSTFSGSLYHVVAKHKPHLNNMIAASLQDKVWLVKTSRKGHRMILGETARGTCSALARSEKEILQQVPDKKEIIDYPQDTTGPCADALVNPELHNRAVLTVHPAEIPVGTNQLAFISANWDPQIMRINFSTRTDLVYVTSYAIKGMWFIISPPEKTVLNGKETQVFSFRAVSDINGSCEKVFDSSILEPFVPPKVLEDIKNLPPVQNKAPS